MFINVIIVLRSASFILITLQVTYLVFIEIFTEYIQPLTGYEN